MQTKLDNNFNTSIDHRLSISWCLELEDGTKIFENQDAHRTHWLEIKQHIEENKLSIKRMHMFAIKNIEANGTFGGANTPMGCKGYFYMRKAGHWYGTGQTLHYYALGYLRNDNLVDIKWYDDNMSLVEAEIRPVDKCQLGLILNYK